MTLRTFEHNRNAHETNIGGKTWYWSYTTCVAYRDDHGNRFRRDRTYSTTTAKHMTLMGVKDWPQVDDATFVRIATA